MLQALEAKLKELGAKIEHSLANHNFLLGAKAALEQVHAEAKAVAPVAEAVLAVVDPAAVPIVEAAEQIIE
jgi:hypothetical protein